MIATLSKHARFPWPRLYDEPLPVGARVTVPTRDGPMPGAVAMRRRGRVTNPDSEHHPILEFEPGSFTRDPAGLYLVQLDAGPVVFAHDGEVRR